MTTETLMKKTEQQQHNTTHSNNISTNNNNNKKGDDGKKRGGGGGGGRGGGNASSNPFADGRLGPVIIAAMALATVTCAVIPAYEGFLREHLTPLLASIYPDVVKQHLYNPTTDHEFNQMMLSTIFGYWIMSFVCTVMDLFPSVTHRWKTQGYKSYFTRREWLDAFGLSTFNMFVSSWFVLMPTFWFHRVGPLRGYTPMTVTADPWEWRTELWKLAVCGLFIDFWFYTTHRALHWRVLYGPIHKLHHRFKAPTAVASMYAHPLELQIGNVLGVILGPALTNCHPYTAYFWWAFSLISTGGSHSGYRFFSARDHDWHHEHFNYCYGVGVFMDKLFRTEFIGTPAWEKAMRNNNNNDDAHNLSAPPPPAAVASKKHE